jgi:hypothetical protein
VPVVDVADNFNRANSSTLGVTSTGAKPWVVLDGTAAINGNVAYLNGVAVIDVETADVEASVTFQQAEGQLFFRVVDLDNFWAVETTETEVIVHRNINGLSYTPLRQNMTVADVHTITITTAATGAVTAAIDGSSVYSGTDTTLASATRVGLAGSASRFDNFVAEPQCFVPTAPTDLLPSGTTVDVGAALTFSWTYHGGSPQTSYSLRYRPTGTSTWTTVSGGSTASHTLTAGTLVADDYEWDVATSNTAGAGPPSAQAFFTGTVAPGTPTLTAPTAGSVVATPTSTVTWTATAQDAYQVEVLVSGAVTYASGTVTSSGTRSHEVTHPVNGRAETVRMRVQDEGIWSSWASAAYTVNYDPPATPGYTWTATGAGFLQVTPAAGTPVDDQPAVVSFAIWRRPTGSADPTGTRLAVGVLPGATWTDAHVAHLEDVEYRVEAVAANGATASSDWEPSEAPPPPPPGAPDQVTGVSVTPQSTTSAQVSWTELEDADSYTVAWTPVA